MKEVVIVAVGRSAIGRAPNGALKYTRPETLGGEVLRGVLDKVPQLKKEDIGDVVIGCSFPEAEQGVNIGKVVAAEAGLPHCVAGLTVNRFCSSGLQAIAVAANSIGMGQEDVVVAGGVESMSAVPMGGNIMCPDPELLAKDPDQYASMGITAENVASMYKVDRIAQDEFSSESHRRSLKAQESGKFKEEIIPVTAKKLVTAPDGTPKLETFIFDTDEGIRPGTSVETLAKLRPIFRAGGSVTAGNSSQTSDGASMVVMMSREKADELGIKPLARFVSFAVAGVDPSIMGIGPIKAIPKVLKNAGLTVEDIDLIELNEAFASQAIACINELGLDTEKVNVNGGAISLGHPLGCTGAFLTTKLVHELQRQQKRYGLVSMCIGGGMGAAGIFERL